MIGDIFCEQFASVGDNLNAKIPNGTGTFDQYLTGNTANSIFLTPVNEEEIVKIVDALKPKKSEGYDKLNTWLIKKIIHNIKTPLTKMINRSMDKGVVPAILKTAVIVPIYKAGEMNKKENYRPVSILSPISKILEKVMFNKLLNFIEPKLSDNQYGFRRNRSTIDLLTLFTGKILTSIDQGQFTAAVFLDLSKAFDSISHEILIKKLSNYGIRGTALKWFENYLKDRKIIVKVNNEFSDMKTISWGVPQGSVVGPLCYIIYTNDIYQSTNCEIVSFADDTTIFVKNKNPTNTKNELVTALKSVVNWFRVNKLCLNLNKSNYIIFRSSRKQLEIENLNTLTVDG